MEPGDSLPFPQETAIGSCPELVEPNLHPRISMKWEHLGV
jgi:hypothetical protein